MGQKVHPIGFRLGFNKTWRSRWYSDRDYAKLLHEDLALRQNLKKRFAHAGVAKIETERAANKLKIARVATDGDAAAAARPARARKTGGAESGAAKKTTARKAAAKA